LGQFEFNWIEQFDTDTEFFRAGFKLNSKNRFSLSLALHDFAHFAQREREREREREKTAAMKLSKTSSLIECVRDEIQKAFMGNQINTASNIVPKTFNQHQSPLKLFPLSHSSKLLQMKR
jgi:hypothetical protein